MSTNHNHNHSSTFTTTIGQGDGEVIVEYEYQAGDPGDYYQPPEPASATIISVTFNNVDIIDCLEDDVIEGLIEKAVLDMNDAFVACLEAKADADLEDRRMEDLGWKP